MAYDPQTFEARKRKYSTFFSQKDPGVLSANLNRLVGAFSPEEKQQIWADSGQTTPFVPVNTTKRKNRWANRFNGWSEPDGTGRRYQIGGQPATADQVAQAAAAGNAATLNQQTTNPSPNGNGQTIPVPTPSFNGGGLSTPGMGMNESNPAGISPPGMGTGGATGLIGQAVNRLGFNNKDYGYDPSLGTVNAATDTVEGRMNGLLGRASQYVIRARNSAAQAMNARGGLNTSMAAGAGEAAAIDSALPIATADAGMYSNQRLANQSATNAARESGSVEANKSYLLQMSGQINAQLENLKSRNISQLSAQEAQQLQTLTAQKGDIDRRLQELVGSQSADLQAQRYGFESGLQGERNAQTLALEEIQGVNRKDLQASATYGQLSSSYSNAVNNIMSNPDTTPAQKQNAVTALSGVYKSQLIALGGISEIDIAGLLDWSSPENNITVDPNAVSPRKKN